MAAAEGGVPNPPTSLDPPLEFRFPEWFDVRYKSVKTYPGEICLHHYFCVQVERNMRVLRRQSQPQPKEEVEEEEVEIRQKEAIEWENRDKALAKKKEEEFMERKLMEEKLKLEEMKKYKRKRKRCEELIEKELNEKELKQKELKQKELKQKEELIKIKKRAEDLRLKFASLDFSLANKKWTVRVDKPYVLSEILSSGTNIGYLVDSHGKRVSFDQLDDKYVLLYFWFLPDHHEPNRCKPNPESIWDLEENRKLHREEFEVVFVALGNNEDVFHKTFSPMPWLAIPHENQEARDFLMREFAIPHKAYQRAVLFAPGGMVESADAASLFTSYGPRGFPFTRQSIDELLNKCYALKKEIFVDKQMPSLTELLGERVIFFSRGEEKVPTSELECKTVGLYFFEPTRKGVQRTRQLLNVWNSLTAEKRDAFEIVIVNKAPYNISNAMAVFAKNFGLSIPWYKVEVCGKKLCRIFGKNSRDDSKAETDGEGDLIVLKPDPYQHLSYFAFNILLKYGSAAYPFTLEGAVTLSKREQQNQLVLGNLLSPEAPLRRGVSSAHHKEDSVDTTVSELFGKRVLLLFATCSCCESGSFLPDLKRMYEKKGTYDDFEIIYMSLDCDESPSSFLKSIQGMPWLVHAFVPHFSVVLAKQLFEIFPPQLPAIAAFGRNGHLETKASNLAFKNDYKSEYPFIQAADMDEEVSRELIYLYKWDLERLSAAVSEGRSFIVDSD